jgi:hypothetical protein
MRISGPISAGRGTGGDGITLSPDAANGAHCKINGRVRQAVDMLRFPAVISTLIDNVIAGRALHDYRGMRATVVWQGYSLLQRKSSD